MTPEEIMRDALRRIKDAKAPDYIKNKDSWFDGYARQHASVALAACARFYTDETEN